MELLSARHRIALGLVGILVSTTLLAVFTGFGPDVRRATMRGREKLCESIAINASILVSRDDVERVEGILSTMVQRDDELLSAALRRADGEIVVQIGDHLDNWITAEYPSASTQVQVPLWAGDEKWGTVQLRFRPISPTGISALTQSPWTAHVLLIGVVTFVLYSFYLRIVLRQLDLSKIESGRMELERARSSPNEVLAQVASVLRIKAEQKAQGAGDKVPLPAKQSPVVALRPSRILVVDDGESNRQLVSLFLRRSGADVSVASNGQIAIEMATHSQFDAILMDMHMPVMDGFTATKQLREMGCTTPIIALTANVAKVDERKCLAAGCTKFLNKPIDMDRLTTTLAELLAVADGAVTAGPAQPTVDPLMADGAAVEANWPPEDAEDALSQQVRAADADLARDLRADGPVFSSLPADDEEFREIVAGFVDRLGQRVVEMRQTFAAGDLEELADQAHWLKGAGAMVGFELFTAPAALMQSCAETGRTEAVGDCLCEIEAIVRRIQHPDVDSQYAKPLAPR